MLSKISNQMNLIYQELSSGKKNLNSKELNVEMQTQQNISDLEQSNKQIEEFLSWSNMLDRNISYLKDKVIETKEKLIGKEDISGMKEEIEKELENKFLNQKLFESKKVLVQPGIYKELSVSKITIPDLTLDNIDEVFDNLNQLHFDVGSFNNNLLKTKEYNSSKINMNKGNLSQVDYTESIAKLNQLKIQYEVVAYTLVKINELSLIKFLR